MFPGLALRVVQRQGCPGGSNLMWRTTNGGRSWQLGKAPNIATATGGEGTGHGQLRRSRKRGPWFA
jgi:hypothetical protein